MGFEIYAEIGVYHPEYLISGLVDILFVKGMSSLFLIGKLIKLLFDLKVDIGLRKQMVLLT